jgi:hypothetical protein
MQTFAQRLCNVFVHRPEVRRDVITLYADGCDGVDAARKAQPAKDMAGEPGARSASDRGLAGGRVHLDVPDLVEIGKDVAPERVWEVTSIRVL